MAAFSASAIQNLYRDIMVNRSTRMFPRVILRAMCADEQSTQDIRSRVWIAPLVAASAVQPPTILVLSKHNVYEKRASPHMPHTRSGCPDLRMQIPAMFWQCEDNQGFMYWKSMSRHDIQPPVDVAWDSVLVRRTIDRKTGVVGETPKEVLTVFFHGKTLQMCMRCQLCHTLG